MSDHMKETLGQPVLVETVTGAGATIGVGRVAAASPDGYMIYVGNWSSSVGAPALYPVSWNPVNDFEPIARLPVSSLMIVGKTSLPVNTAKELIDWLKANPGKGAAGTTGVGSGIQLCMIYFQNHTGTKFPLVPYRGAAPVMQDLAAGQIDLSCPEAGQTLPQYRAGTIKAFAVLTDKRWFAAPDVPTIDEAGVPGLHFPFWHGMWAPKGTPKDVIARINAAVVEALADPEVRKRFTELGHEVAPREQQTPAGLATIHKAEIEKWWPIIKAADIKAQ
jgi:tripartite-type tricarboxylate transporter receptor subunit TctC